MKWKPDQSLPVKPMTRMKTPKHAKIQFEIVVEKVKCGNCSDCEYWAKAYMVSQDLFPYFKYTITEMKNLLLD